MKPEEKPAPESRCIVESCARPASTFVDSADSETLEGDRAVIMSDVLQPIGAAAIGELLPR